MFPLIGVLSSIAVAVGGYVLWWHEHLSSTDKAKADQLAMEYSKKLYNKALKQLTVAQFDIVQGLVKSHLSK